MKTGEILITIHKQDIKYLVKDLLGLPTDKLSPFSATIELNQAAVAPAETLQSLAQNADVVKCLTALSAPTGLLNIRLGGPATSYSEMAVCKTQDNAWVILITGADSYNLMVADNEDDLKGFLASAMLGKIEKEAEAVFPQAMSMETFVLLANIIDAYRFANYRDALQHKDFNIPKLTVAEFNDLLKASLSQVDFRWVLSNLKVLLPELLSYYKTEGESSYNFLFDKGYLLSGKDNKTGEDYLLLNIISADLGAEFMNTWYSSAGISLSFMENGTLKTLPQAFICATVAANHVFSFDKTSEQLHYKMLTHKNAVGYIALLLSELNNIVPEKVEPKTRFCIQCGSEIIQGGKFCGKCGAKIPS